MIQIVAAILGICAFIGLFVFTIIILSMPDKVAFPIVLFILFLVSIWVFYQGI